MKLGGRTVHGSSTSVQAPCVVGFAASSLGLLCPRWDCWACRILCDFQVLALPPISKCTWPCHRCRLRHATVGCGMPLRCQGGGLLYCCPAPQVAVRQSSHWQCSLCCILPRCVPTSLKRGGAQRRRLLVMWQAHCCLPDELAVVVAVDAVFMRWLRWTLTDTATEVDVNCRHICARWWHGHCMLADVAVDMDVVSGRSSGAHCKGNGSPGRVRWQKRDSTSRGSKVSLL